MAETKKIKYSADVFHGSRLSPKVQRRLEALQKSAEGQSFGYSKFQYTEGGQTRNMSYKEAFQSRNFDGTAELSSRKPWVRVWTAIQPFQLKKDQPKTKAAQQQGQITEQQAIFKAEPEEIRLYEMGNSQYIDYVEGQVSPGSARNSGFMSLGGGDSESVKPGKFLTKNPFSKPNIAVKAVKDVSLGNQNGGLVKETVVDFTVFNMHDYENIVLPFFLRPGAEVFVDYGWDTAGAYAREEALAEKRMLKKIFESKTGHIDQSNGDMNCIYGLVSDFNSSVRRDGGWDCTMTIMSTNFALIDFTQASGPSLAPLIETSINTTLFDFWNNAMGIEFNMAEDTIYDTTSDRRQYGFMLHSALLLKLQFYEFDSNSRPGRYRSNIFELDEKEIEAGITYQPFQGVWRGDDTNGKTFDSIKAIDNDAAKLPSNQKKLSEFFAQKLGNVANTDPMTNMFVSMKWLEAFLNKNIGFL